MTAISITDLNNAKTDVDHLASVATSLALTATDRLGGIKSTLSAAIDSIKSFTSRGAWVTATAYVGKDLVSSGGSWYVCVIAHTASASFGTDAANWRLYQGVTTGDLSDLFASGLMGHIDTGVGSVPVTIQAKLRERVSVYSYYLAVEATAEGMINRAIQANTHVHVPAGVYSIDCATGVQLKTGTVLTGDGKNKTIFSGLLGSGGSLAQLAGYTSGSIIKRVFNPATANAYVNDIYISDIGVVLNHTEGAITATAIQIGFDMRNITGATVERCHAGNIPPVGGPIAAKVGSKTYLVQGYPVVFGNVSGSDPAYAGGEKNRLLNCSVYGGYKCVIQDESTLSPTSASYATIVRDCDIQTGHWLIGQMGQYGAGNVHLDNILQDVQKQSGDVSASYVQYYDGYNNRVRPAYIEAGTADNILYLDTDANNNLIDMVMYSFTAGAGAITDASNANSYNRITYFSALGVGKLVELYNKANKSCWVKFHWDGGAIVIDGSNGVSSVTRTGAGDYTITWEKVFGADDYNISILTDTNTSGHGGLGDISSHSASNVRIFTYSQNAGTSTQIDPRYVWVGANQ